MPLITNNLVVGGKEPVATVAAPPTNNKQMVKEDLGSKFSFGKFVNLSIEEPKQAVKIEQPKIVKRNVVQEEQPVSRYIQKQDGELVRHINTKSQYLKDIFEDFEY